jgi:hypothetical protein
MNGLLTVLDELPEVLILMSGGWFSWLVFSAVVVFSILAISMAWNGRGKPLLIICASALLLGLSGYFSAFAIGGGYDGIALLFFSVFIILIAISVIAVALPIYFLRRRSARQIESQF